MSLLCHLFSHKRSRSRATFDEINRCWVSECKRCYAVLVRERPGDWREAPPEPLPLVGPGTRTLRSCSFTILAA